MSSLLSKSDLSTVDRVWVDDPIPPNAPGGFYGYDGGGDEIRLGVPLPTGTATNNFIGGDLFSGGLASSPGGFSPPNPSYSGGGNDGGGGGGNDGNYETVFVPANPNNPGSQDHYVRIPKLPDGASSIQLT